MPPLLHIEVACAENRVIGRDGRLPWHIPEDQEVFHSNTAGQVVLLGRICYEVWPRVRSDGRTPIVVTSRPASALSTARHADSGAPPATVGTFSDALREAERIASETGQRIHICGGARIYAETLALERPLRLNLTFIEGMVEGDTHFPEWRDRPWQERSRRQSNDASHRYTFFVLDRG
jgi:dihydrofolate reductase